jgi:hypothetical protein
MDQRGICTRTTQRLWWWAAADPLRPATTRGATLRPTVIMITPTTTAIIDRALALRLAIDHQGAVPLSHAMAPIDPLPAPVIMCPAVKSPPGGAVAAVDIALTIMTTVTPTTITITTIAIIEAQVRWAGRLVAQARAHPLKAAEVVATRPLPL